jgi:hypothetical protein
MLNALNASTFTRSLTRSVNENTLYSEMSALKLYGPSNTVCENGLAPAVTVVGVEADDGVELASANNRSPPWFRFSA